MLQFPFLYSTDLNGSLPMFIISSITTQQYHYYNQKNCGRMVLLFALIFSSDFLRFSFINTVEQNESIFVNIIIIIITNNADLNILL